MDFKSTNPLGIIGIVGAVILIIGAVTSWYSIEVLGHTYTYSGLDIFNNKDHCADDLKYTFVPLVCLILGIISLVIMFVPTLMNAEKFQTINNVLGIVALVLAVAAVVCAILFYTQTVDFGYGVTKKLTDMVSFKFGFWLALVGAIITLVGGVMPILKNKGIINF